MSRSTTELLREAQAHLSLVKRHATNDLGEQLVIDAICLRLAAGVEVLNRLDPRVRTEIFGDDWPLMWGMRNRIVHGYVFIDADVIRRTIEVDVPMLIDRILSAVER